MKFFKIEKKNNRVLLYLLGIKISFKFRELKLKELYNEEFFRNRERSYISAINIIKKLKNILPDVKSVLDVGCGSGTWLKAWGGGAMY